MLLFQQREEVLCPYLILNHSLSQLKIRSRSRVQPKERKVRKEMKKRMKMRKISFKNCLFQKAQVLETKDLKTKIRTLATLPKSKKILKNLIPM